MLINYIIKLFKLQTKFKRNHLTEFGYLIKKWKLLKKFLEPEVSTEIRNLKRKFKSGKINRANFCCNVKKLISNSLNGEELHPVLKIASKIESNSSEDSCSINGAANERISLDLNHEHLAKKFKNNDEGSGACNSDDNKQKVIDSIDLTLDDEDNKVTENSRKNIELCRPFSIKIHRIVPKPKKKITKCLKCAQNLDNVEYVCHPNEAECENIVLKKTELEENCIDEKFDVKITKFSVYDENGHLCPIDKKLIEKGVKLFLSGYVKPIFDESPEPVGGFAAKDLGPLMEWWIAGYDGGEKALIGFSSEVADYYLMDPSDHYAPLFKELQEKIFLGKWIIDYLNENRQATYPDLLNNLPEQAVPSGMLEVSEEMLLKHVQFICDQANSLDAMEDRPDEDGFKMNQTPCMQRLIELAHVTSSKKKSVGRPKRKIYDKSKLQKPRWTLATTTNLVKNIFETFFPNQLDKDGSESNFLTVRKRCNVCLGCQAHECGTCRACLDKPKYGGSGNRKQPCINRRCTDMIIKKGEDDEFSDEEDCEILDRSTYRKINRNPIRNVRKIQKDIRWKGKGIFERNRIYYRKVMIDSVEYTTGSYVFVVPNEPATPSYIGQIRYMWEGESGEKWFHSHWLYSGSETVLSETGDRQELFLTDQCADAELFSIRSSVSVTYRKTPLNWKMMGNCEQTICSSVGPDDGKTFFYQKRYNSKDARFEDVLDETEFHTEDTKKYKFCLNCKLSENFKRYETPVPDEKFYDVENNKETLYEVVKWRGDEYRVGSCVFLDPDALKLKNYSIEKRLAEETKKPEYNFDEYPEKYRKTDNNKSNNDFTPEPFGIGYIVGIMSRNKTSKNILLRIKKFYRPENTVNGDKDGAEDVNLLYWTNSECVLEFSNVTGKCYVWYDGNINEPIGQWSQKGPYRFYFSKAYNPQMDVFYDAPAEATKLGCNKQKEIPTVWPHISRPLKTLDVFAGCGGLSEGLHQAKIGESCWAIELEEEIANAFKLNNPNSTVFTDDCNDILKMVISGKTENDKGQKLPMKGEVEMICGGPPCQGFSGLNRFSDNEYSKFKNSLIVTFLSYCDYYRPRYFILENVRNFVSSKKSMFLKLTLRCLLRLGYQCTFGILQAGSYGIPQTRRRVIILGAAPGEKLPKYPEPWHVFSSKGQKELAVNVNELKFTRNHNWLISAPYKKIKIKDAISDLPTLKSGDSKEKISYDGPPLTHFQRMIRDRKGVLRDHICRKMSPIMEKRISLIPKDVGYDWRDLPNIIVQLSDGSYTKKLRYKKYENDKSSTGTLRGVCACVNGHPCDLADKQNNTLIPWCLAHTATKYNHWSGSYGRLDFNGFFQTVITTINPTGKLGQVLHPEQDRIVSVRECARFQGFPDSYRFCGNILDKHKQIGNAVPPPMGKAVGLEIRKALNEMNRKKDKSSDTL